MHDVSNCGNRYREKLASLLKAITDDESENINKAAEMMAGQIIADRLIHVYGAGGHSFVGSEEFFYRAGGLACISPMYELSLSLAAGGQKSTMLERVPGIGDKIVAAHHLGKEDLLIITSLYGINAATVDAALEARRRNCRIIAITSTDFANATPEGFVARHPSGQNLADLADVTINQHVPHGEVILDIEGFEQRMGGSGNVLQCFTINWLVMRTAEILLERNCPPPVWRSANVPGGDEYNLAYLEKYTPRIKAL